MVESLTDQFIVTRIPRALQAFGLSETPDSPRGHGGFRISPPSRATDSAHVELGYLVLSRGLLPNESLRAAVTERTFDISRGLRLSEPANSPDSITLQERLSADLTRRSR